MKNFWNDFKNNAIAGVLFLLPLYVLMIIFQKVFGAFAKFGSGMAKYFGLDTVLGKNMANVFGVLLLMVFLVVCGFLVRLSFFKRISDTIDNNLKIYLPGYEKHKELAKQKLIKEEKKDEVVPVVPPKIPILFMQNDSWIPAFLQEKNENGEAVVYVLDPNTSLKSSFYLTTTDKIKILNNVSETELLQSISNNGQGFLELLNK
jgi:uncharacterized membrane protein